MASAKNIPATMQAAVFTGPGMVQFKSDVKTPAPADNQILLEVEACAICRTDLHVVDGDLKYPKKSVIPGHEIVGKIVALGSLVNQDTGLEKLEIGKYAGVAWLGATCGSCDFCRSKRENLCDQPTFTGYTKDGGFAQYIACDYRFVFPLPETITEAGFDPAKFSPMLCAGLIGWRSLRFARPALDASKEAGKPGRLGIYGFGAAGHIVAQVARQMGYEVYAFVREADQEAIDFALGLGCVYAGASCKDGPEKLDAAIIFATAGDLVPQAMKNLRRGGMLVLGGIHMSEIPGMPYDILWGERTIQSVANLTRADGYEFMQFLADHKIETTIKTMPLAKAQEALTLLRDGKVSGAIVLTPDNG